MVEIIPRPIQKTPSWQKILFYASVFILAGIILGSLISGSLQKKYQAEIKTLEETLVQEKTPDKVAMEKDVILWQKKINDFTTLIAGHSTPSEFFTNFEEVCHPRVKFSQFNLDVSAASLGLSGTTDNFTTLAQQLFIFNNQSFIKSYDLTNISIGTKGGVDFGLTLSLDPEVFKQKPK